jgi:excinuclease ABC subunit B
MAYNEKHGITPTSAKRNIKKGLDKQAEEPDEVRFINLAKGELNKKGEVDIAKDIKALKKEMLQAAENLEFELAAEMRDRVKELEAIHLKLGGV